MTGTTAGPADEPCRHCPFRRDVPSGIWDPDQYAKLAARDVETAYQPAGLFLCHLYGKDERRRVCAGAAGCYDADHLLALRVALITGEITPEVADQIRTYVSPVPLFASGVAAALHGLAEITNTSAEARAAIDKLEKIISARSAGAESDGGEPAAGADAEPWAAQRSALIHNVRDRENLVFHIGRHNSMAACSRWFLEEDYVLDPAEVPSSLRCRRPACRKHWPD